MICFCWCDFKSVIELTLVNLTKAPREQKTGTSFKTPPVRCRKATPSDIQPSVSSELSLLIWTTEIPIQWKSKLVSSERLWIWLWHVLLHNRFIINKIPLQDATDSVDNQFFSSTYLCEYIYGGYFDLYASIYHIMIEVAWTFQM